MRNERTAASFLERRRKSAEIFGQKKQFDDVKRWIEAQQSRNPVCLPKRENGFLSPLFSIPLAVPVFKRQPYFKNR